jgi:UDP-N-acetylglucosamine 4,6-dehydratase/UDP-glucose 4-epimerase
MELIKNKKYLITGGTGFLGIALVEKLLLKQCSLRVMSRNEGKLISLKEKFPSIEIYSGDVSDQFEIHQAMKDIDGVFHLAASKHVGLAEKFVRECVKSNTIGSLNILEESLNKKLDFIIGISTDKAAQVAGVYGASKLLMERLFSQYEKLNNDTKYRIVRYGNVLYSTGSVLCKWKDLIQNNKQCVVTDLDATRFYWTVEQAIKLIFDCLDQAIDSTPFCPDMKSMKIEDLLRAMYIKYGNGEYIEPKIIGLQIGENKHEKIFDCGPYSNEVESFTIDEILNLI